jgi:CRP/FNR family transcriptional regulator
MMSLPPRGTSRESFMSVFGALLPKDEWPPIKLEPVLASLQYRILEEGTIILREGQICSAVPFVLDGSIRVFKTSENGREITLYRIEKGQSCILSLGCGKGIDSFPATVVAEQRTSAAFIPSDTVKRLFTEGPSFRDFVREQYTRRMAEVIELVEEIAFRRVDERLIQTLTELRSTAGLVTTTHQELADHVGTSREVVSRILKDLEQRGTLEISRGSVQLLPSFDKLRV